MPTISEFLTAALAEIRVARAGDVIGPDDMDLALFVFNEYLDALNADGRALYSVDVGPIRTLTPNLQPHTIGPTGTFVVTTRPVEILAANLTITAASPATRIPLNIRDDQWWMDVRSRLIATAHPTDLFYNPTFPNGEINLWPVPTTAYGLELEMRTVLASVIITDTFSLPPGYQQALRLTMAELLAPAFGQTVSQSTRDKARDARGKVWANNDQIPNAIPDRGVPLGGPKSGGYNYRTGSVE
jgi:hypothetical protein